MAASIPALTFPLTKGPYQNNGATPWYADLSFGIPGQPMKFALDSGSNFIWVTSTLCAPTSCQHYGNGRFDYAKSITFRWIDTKPIDVSFGPWGTMTVETGNDNLHLPGGQINNTTLYLAQDYSGSQFSQLDWDGGIGIPSGSPYVQPGVSFFPRDLLNRGYMDPNIPYVSFCTDQASGTGSCIFGGYDTSKFDPYAYIYLPWKPYTEYSGVEYIWSTPLNRYTVGSTTVANNVMFCLDSGSSQFKGDDNIMNTTLQLIKSAPTPPTVSLELGITSDTNPGQITIGPDIYNVTIEAGPQKGQTLPQFNPLGLKNLVLVGSVIMDQVYTIYEYGVYAYPEGYYLTPTGMWIFNKVGGPPIITSRSATAWAPRKPAALTHAPVRRI